MDFISAAAEIEMSSFFKGQAYINANSSNLTLLNSQFTELVQLTGWSALYYFVDEPGHSVVVQGCSFQNIQCAFNQTGGAIIIGRVGSAVPDSAIIENCTLSKLDFTQSLIQFALYLNAIDSVINGHFFPDNHPKLPGNWYCFCCYCWADKFTHAHLLCHQRLYVFHLKLCPQPYCCV